jgi:hypothetical protein
MSSKNNVNPAHYKVAGRLRQGEDILHEQNKREFSQARISKEEKGREWRPGNKRSDESKVPAPLAKSSGRAKSRQTRPSPAAAEDRARRSDRESEQLSGKKGSRSSARKQAASRHGTRPMPATSPVAGAFGRTGRPSEAEEEIVQKKPASRKSDQVLKKRKRVDSRTRK